MCGACQSNPQPWQVTNKVGSLHYPPHSQLCHQTLVIRWRINVIKAIGCLRAFLMHCIGRRTYAVQINTKLVFLLEVMGANERFVLLMRGACVSTWSCWRADLSLLVDAQLESIICQCPSTWARVGHSDPWGYAELKGAAPCKPHYFFVVS